MLGTRDCDVAVVEVDTPRATVQLPRRLTTQRYAYISSLVWTRDGSAVIYEALGPSNFGFWRVTIDGDHAPERIEIERARPQMLRDARLNSWYVLRRRS